MKIVYYSLPCFADCDFPLVRELQRMGHDVYYFLDLPCYFLNSTLFSIMHQVQAYGIMPAITYPELKVYEDYFSMKKMWVVNRTHEKALYPLNISIHYRLAKMIDEINPDVVHVVGWIDTNQCFLYRFRKRMVLTVHDPFPHTGEQSFRREFFRKLSMRLVPKFVLLSDCQKQDFVTAYHLRPSQVYVNKLGTYDCILRYPVKRMVNGKRYVLFCGRISPYKGIEYLLEAMKKLHDVYPDVELIVAGGGDLYFDYSPYQGLSYIHLLNRYIEMAELAQLLVDCEYVVCPYTDATQSGVIHTAFSMGKTVVATDVGALKEVVIDGFTGLLVPPRDSGKLGEAMIELLSDKMMKRNMEKNISEMCKTKWSWNEIAETYILVYKA